jgi:tRNA modification GTPase
VLSEKLKEIKGNIINALSFVEFELDISEEDLVEEPIKIILDSTKTAWVSVKKLSNTYKEGRLINRGASVVITGGPNVGKSTLLNALLEENKAIVSETPGTTRDVVDAHLIYDGISITLTDTAGIRETRDSIEKEGVKRAINKVREADLVLNVLDSKERFHTNTADFKGSVITVLNKIDLLSETDNKSLNKYFKNPVCVSALTGDGIPNLKREIKRALHMSNIFSDEVYLITQRQYSIAKTSLQSISNAIDKLKSASPPLELVSVDLRDALSAVDQMLGKTTSDDILNNIFGRFCIGK